MKLERDALRSEIDALRSQIDPLQSQIEEMEKMIRTVPSSSSPGRSLKSETSTKAIVDGQTTDQNLLDESSSGSSSRKLSTVHTDDAQKTMTGYHIGFAQKTGALMAGSTSAQEFAHNYPQDPSLPFDRTLDTGVKKVSDLIKFFQPDKK